MKKWSVYAVLVIQMILIQSKLSAQELTLLKNTNLRYYPSSSAIEFYNNRIYVIGDDATHMLMLDTQHNIVDSVALIHSLKRRLTKDEKPDLEAMTIIRKKGKPIILAISSFSTSERNSFFHTNLSIEFRQ